MKMLLPIAALFVLTACGGSSDADAPSSQTKLKEPLKVIAHQSSTCGGSIAATQAELFTYDDNWNITGRHKAAADGSFMLNTNDKLINFSVVNNLGDRQQPKVHQRVFAQVQPGDFGTLYLGSSSQNCECTQAKANIATVSSTALTSMRIFNEYHVYNYATLSGNTATFEICRQKGAEWPVLMMSARNTNKQEFYAVLENYQPTQQLLINLDKEALPVAVTSNIPLRFVSSNHVSKHAVLRVDNRSYQTPMFIPGVKDLNVVSYSTTQSESLSSSSDESLGYYVGQLQSRSSDFQRPVAFVLPELSLASRFAFQVASGWSNLQNAVNYDFSSYSDFTAVDVMLETYTKDYSYISQTFIGPVKGKFPVELLPAEYLNGFVTSNIISQSLDVSLEQLSSASNLTSYAKQQNKYYSSQASKVERQGDVTYLGMYLYKYY